MKEESLKRRVDISTNIENIDDWSFGFTLLDIGFAHKGCYYFFREGSSINYGRNSGKGYELNIRVCRYYEGTVDMDYTLCKSGVIKTLSVRGDNIERQTIEHTTGKLKPSTLKELLDKISELKRMLNRKYKLLKRGNE